MASERRPSIFEMLHFGIPREPEFTGKVTMWMMPVSADEEEDVAEKRRRMAAVRTASTLSSLPKSRINRYNTDSEINTIYGVCRENIASRGLSVPSKPPTPLHSHLLPVDVHQHEERDYIDKCLFQDPTGDNFTKMIMQNFFKAPKSKHLGYGMPRPETREDAQNRLISHLSRKPSVVRVPSHTSLCKPIKGENHSACSEEFCEILGPGCCSSCIETTNRQIAEEIQRRLFPEIEVSRRCLVAPKLTKVMKDGHHKQVRRKRLHDLRQPAKGTAITEVTQRNLKFSSQTNEKAPKTNEMQIKRETTRFPTIDPPQPTFTASSLGSFK